MAKIQQVLLIDPDFIKSITNISNNTQDKFMHAAIRETTDIDLQEVIGTKLLNKLKTLIVENTIGDDENVHYKELLDESKYFMAYSVVSRLVVISSVKIDNIGAKVTGDDKATTLELKNIYNIESYYKEKADFYKRRLQQFIRKNYEYYPEVMT